MRCPKCEQSTYQPGEPCPNCQFSGDPALIEELAHIEWVLSEIETWRTLLVEEADRQRVWLKFTAGERESVVELIEQKYTSRRRELELALGLRLPAFSEAEAEEAWPDLIQRELLLEKVAEWLAKGLINPVATQTMVDEARRQVDELQEQLEGHPRPPYPETDRQRLEIVNFLLEAVNYLRQHNGLSTPQAELQILSPLLTEKENLEVKLGLRPAPEPINQAAAQPIREQRDVSREVSDKQVTDVPPAHPSPRPAAPAPPIPLRERLWQTLLSERTLQAMLFLGIFLLFSAAISFVIWGWKDFSAPLRVAIPTGFTAIFFALGWYVRTKTDLYRSGIALSAIAALLIPIDFYTIYVNFNIPADYWPLFWLITSLVCLVAYTIVTLLIDSRFFGYLVGTAAGSTVLAMIEVGHQAIGLSLDWRTASLSGLALGLIILGTVFARHPRAGRWRVFSEPFRYLSLLTVGVLMPLTFGWRFIDRGTYDTLHYALTVNWWLGGFIFGWGAIFHRSRGLGLLAAIALPVATYLAQAALFNQVGINPAWHAFGWAWLVPLYFIVGYKLLAYKEEPIIHGHGRTATGWGVALLIIAALWSLVDLTSGAAAASSHALLAGSVVLAVFLWQRPNYLYAASLLSFSAITFTMAELDLTLAQLSVGWASLAIVHIVIGINLGIQFPIPIPNYANPLVVSGYVIAGLALLPPIFPYDGNLMVYTLGNWLGLTVWGARLAHMGQPGFVARSTRYKAIFHWLTALPLPIWLWLLFTNHRPLDFSLPLTLAVLAWAMVSLGYRLVRTGDSYRLPWYLTGGMISIAAPILAFVIVPYGFTPAITLLLIGLLYFADAITGRQSGGLILAGFVTAWGYLLFLSRFPLSFDVLTFALAWLITIYFGAGLWAERQARRAVKPEAPPFTHQFLAPLYLTTHILTVFLLWRIYVQPFNRLFFDAPWTDTMRLWGAASQLLVGIIYALYAWGTYKERWGHAAAWLAAASGGFIAITYSTGRGSSAAKAALLAIVFILAERGLYWLRQRPGVRNRLQAYIRLIWPLYKRPLLVTGWAVSAIVIGLALIRNLWLLGGGHSQQIWAVVGLLLITGLYALSARLFRQARFMWLAAALIFAPWTILTNLGWFTVYRPTLPGFALSWVILAWAFFLSGLLLNRVAAPAYALPLKTVAHILLPFALLWGVANVDTSRFTVGLAAGMYGLAAWLDHRRLKNSDDEISILRVTKFFYPTLGLIPVWCVYLMAWLLPTARHEHYGMMLLLFGPLGLMAGQWLKSVAPTQQATRGYALPGYLTGYISLIVGTMLVAHMPSLLALVLLFDASLMAISAWLFKHPLWVYPAAVMVPISLLISLGEAGVAGNRHGWWLIGLASIYLALTWALRRVKLSAYSTGLLAVGFALIAFGLPPSSRDQTGALWGYGSAALLYAITAFWLEQPLLLTPASALIIVPYAISLQKSSLPPDYYGLALFPGAIVALAAGWGLDKRFGSWRDFPWENPVRWPVALADRLLGWWGLPLYGLGFGLAMASPLFTEFRAALSALNFLLLMPVFGWAIYRFRLRVWLLAMVLAGHLAAVYFLEALGWWRYPAWAWFRFLPVPLITILVALLIERRRGEGSPLHAEKMLAGWSRPLYLVAAFDIIFGQLSSLGGTWTGATVTLTHALLMAVLASIWLSAWLPYVSATLGVVTLLQWGMVLERPIEDLPVGLAQLALGYGIIGYGLALLRGSLDEDRELHPWLAVWELPLQRFSIGASFVILGLTGLLGVNLAGWTVRAMFGLPFRHIVDLTTVKMVVGVFSLLGLLYVAAALAHRWLRLGYMAIGMLGISWWLYAFYVQQWDNLAQVQWYAIPAGLYLLGIAYLEWQRGNKVLGRWLDYAAMLLMMGSLFWQTLLFGWGYALLLGGEGFSAFWWGSARRLRRFFYAGIVGVILATLGQLINSLRSINQWIVFGIIGSLLIIVAVFVERKLEDIKLWQEKIFETWE